MLGYVTVGVCDMAKAEEFYTALLAEVGAKKLLDTDRIKFFGTSPDESMLAICIPHDKQQQNCGNGNMIAIPGGDQAGVANLYQKALELGATDDGEPGGRNPVFFGAYVRDPDGNKICFFDMNL